MRKGLLVLSLLVLPTVLTGCIKGITETKVHPDSKDVTISLEEYNQLESGMTEDEVWAIIGGQCTNTGTTDLGLGEAYKTVSYGCNGEGSLGANAILMFQGGKLTTMSQAGLK